MKPRHDDGNGYKRGAGPYSKDNALKCGPMGGENAKYFNRSMADQASSASMLVKGKSKVTRNDGAAKARKGHGIDGDGRPLDKSTFKKDWA